MSSYRNRTTKILIIPDIISKLMHSILETPRRLLQANTVIHTVTTLRILITVNTISICQAPSNHRARMLTITIITISRLRLCEWIAFPIDRISSNWLDLKSVAFSSSISFAELPECTGLCAGCEPGTGKKGNFYV